MNIIFSILIVLLSAILTKIFCFIAQNTRLMDHPNNRSLHLNPTIRGGGVVFIALPLLMLPFLYYLADISLIEQSVLIISILLLAIVSFLDDLFQLPVKPRFLVQIIVAILIALFMRPIELDFGLFSLQNQVLIIPFLFFAVLWAINHFNFMDGIDGFCATQALFLFFSYVILFGFYNAQLYQNVCFIFMFSLMGFLIFNFPPAKLFMGDVGSATLGLIVFCIAVIAQQKYQIPTIYWFMLNALFLFDATITLFRRVIKKEKWSAAHKKHAYQRLKQLGVNPTLILCAQIIINFLFLFLVLLVHMHRINLIKVLFFQLFCMLSIYYSIEIKFPMFQK